LPEPCAKAELARSVAAAVAKARIFIGDAPEMAWISDPPAARTLPSARRRSRC
jgi:hypothetical protein